jgi:hypothetical protein
MQFQDRDTSRLILPQWNEARNNPWRNSISPSSAAASMASALPVTPPAAAARAPGGAKRLASGASASAKLIHGGLRYLEHGWVRLVREALIDAK